MDSQKFQSIVCTLYDDDALRSELEHKNIPVYSLSMKHIYDAYHGIPRLCRLLREKNPDILHTQLFGANIYGRIFGKLFSVPVVMSTVQLCDYSNMEPGLYSCKRKVLDYLTGKLCVNAHVAVSQSVKRHLMTHLAIPQHKIEVIYNYTDTAFFKANLAAKEEFLKGWNIKSSNLVISSIGRLEAQKGHVYLIEAFSRLIRQYPNLKLFIAGKGSLFYYLKSLIQDLSLEKSVYLMGEIKDVRELLSVSDIFVLPSLNEGFSLVLLEAMAMKKACIASDIPQISEVITHGKSGWLFEPKNIETLTQALEELVVNTNQRNQLGENAFKVVQNQFEKEKNVKHLESLYESLLSVS